MPHTRQWGSPHPGCLIILLDQSGSMSDPFGGQHQMGFGKRKCEMVSTVLNSLLNEFVHTNTVGPDVKPRADVAVIGYGPGVRPALQGSLASKDFVSLPDLAANPLRIDQRMTKEMDETGNIIEIPVRFPVWVDAVAENGTPMCQALMRARDLAADWAAKHPDNYPPVVINITDGEAGDGDISIPARQLMQVQTNDGELLLFNCHITNTSEMVVEFPPSDAALSHIGNPYARQLYDISSAIPEESRKMLGLAAGTRGFIYNGDAQAVRNMFTFATVQATQGDPNR